APPQIGTLTGAPSITPNPNYPSPDGAAVPEWSGTYAGPINPGDGVVLTAGNVYAISAGANITQAAFYLDTNNNGVLDAGDQLLGKGTSDTADPNATQNYQLTISTTGMAAGTYTIFAQAKDNDGFLSNPIAMTL